MESRQRSVPIDVHVYDIWANCGSDPWNSSELATAAGSFLCYGPRGCGKTFLANAFFNAAGKTRVDIRAVDILRGTEREISARFVSTPRDAVSAILVDDIDNVMAGLRSRPSAHQALLEQLKHPASGRTIFATAARPEDLQPNEIEAFQYVLPVFYGDELLREMQMAAHAEDVPLSPFVRLNKIAESTEWWSAQELMLLLRTAPRTPRGVLEHESLLEKMQLIGSNIVPEQRAKKTEQLFRFTAEHCTSRYVREDIKYRFGPDFTVPSNEVPAITHINIESLTMIEKNFEAPVGVYVESGAQVRNVKVNQKWTEAAQGIDVSKLASELGDLLLKLQNAPPHPGADGNTADAIASAKAEASRGNGAKALEYLSKAGGWVINVAKEMGVKIAAEALTRALGIGGPDA